MFFFFFFQAEDGIRDVAVTGVQTCALPISLACSVKAFAPRRPTKWSVAGFSLLAISGRALVRSEEHTSELQSRLHLVCRLLLEKKKKKHKRSCLKRRRT